MFSTTPEEGHVQVPGHVHRLLDDERGEVLRGDDEDHPVDRDRLEDRERDVTRTRAACR